MNLQVIMKLTQTVGKIVISLSTYVAVVSGVVLFTWTLTFSSLTMVAISTFEIALARPTCRVAKVAVAAGVTVGSTKLRFALTLPS